MKAILILLCAAFLLGSCAASHKKGCRVNAGYIGY
jgi:hypothetical protein